MKRFDHGGDIAETSRQLGVPAGGLLDFSASINPLGMPPAVLDAARNALDLAVHYPEVDAASFIEALADFHQLPPEYFLPGAGSTPLLYLLPRVLRPRRALLVTPCFSEYERGLALAGTLFDYFPLSGDDSFAFDLDRFRRQMTDEIDLVILANPGNPTGAGIPPAVVEAITLALHGKGVVAVDEAFVDFCPHLSVIDRLQQHPNLYVFRSLTKFYAIPGLRAGYLVGPMRGIARLAAAVEPWAISAPALAAATACLREETFRQQTLAAIPVLREQLLAGLSRLGLTVFPGEANYLLARLAEGGPDAAVVAAALRSRRILVRDCAGFSALDPRYLRLAVRAAEENDRLLDSLGEILSQSTRGNE